MPLIIWFAVAGLACLLLEDDKPAPQVDSEIPPEVKENKSPCKIDTSENSVPSSDPSDTENSVPTDQPKPE